MGTDGVEYQGRLVFFFLTRVLRLDLAQPRHTGVGGQAKPSWSRASPWSEPMQQECSFLIPNPKHTVLGVSDLQVGVHPLGSNSPLPPSPPSA